MTPMTGPDCAVFCPSIHTLTQRNRLPSYHGQAVAMPAVGCAASALRERQSRGSTHFPNLFWPSLLVGVNRCSPSRVRLGNAPHIIPGCGVSKRARKRLFSLKTGGGAWGLLPTRSCHTL